jgi:phage host-nuclease inhibitor protein Gam
MGLAAVRHRGEQGGILSVEDLDEAIKLVGLCDIEKERINHDLDVQVKALKAEALEKAAEVADRRQAWLAMIETFMEARRDEVLGDKKSVTLNYGKVGYRKTTDKIELPKKGSPEMEELVDAVEILQEKDAPGFHDIAIHRQRWVAKGDIKGLDTKDLERLGIEFTVGGDSFFCQPDRQKVRTGKELQNG